MSAAPDLSATHALQRAFASHLRDPAHAPAPADVEPRRMAIYSELFFNNVESLLSANFPVIRSLYGDDDWRAFVRAFYRDHRCHTPLFTDLARELSRYLETRDEGEEIATTGIIFQEVLQGIRGEREYARMREVLWATLILEPRELSTYEVAAQLYRRARSEGFTVRKPNDCLIAALALEHGALLVHNDRDFLALAQVEPALLVYPGRPH